MNQSLKIIFLAFIKFMDVDDCLQGYGSEIFNETCRGTYFIDNTPDLIHNPKQQNDFAWGELQKYVYLGWNFLS